MTEREVETTYLEEKTKTETVHFCDACGLDCDDRGGRKQIMVTRGETPSVDWRSFKRSLSVKFHERIVREFGREEEVELPRTAIMGDRSTREPSTQYVTKDVVAGKDAVNGAEKVLESAVNEISFDSYEMVSSVDEYDICMTCVGALAETEGVLETSLAEVEDDEDEDEEDSHTQMGKWESTLEPAPTSEGARIDTPSIFPIESTYGYLIFSFVIVSLPIVALSHSSWLSLLIVIFSFIAWGYDFWKT